MTPPEPGDVRAELRVMMNDHDVVAAEQHVHAASGFVQEPGHPGQELEGLTQDAAHGLAEARHPTTPPHRPHPTGPADP